MPLDLSSLIKAVNSLERTIKYASSQIKGSPDSVKEEVIMSGVIQNFEFTYELCWKFIRRWLEINGEGASVDGATRKEIFRIAAERQLIDNVETWFEYTKARNETAHTYDIVKAKEIYKITKKFLEDAKLLLKILENKND